MNWFGRNRKNDRMVPRIQDKQDLIKLTSKSVLIKQESKFTSNRLNSKNAAYNEL